MKSSRISNPNHFVLTAPKIRNKWLDSGRFLDWNEIAKIKLPRAVSNGKTVATGRLAGSYDIVTKAGTEYEVSANDLDTKHTIMYTDKLITAQSYGNQLRKIGYGDFTIVALPSNRMAKFVRNFGQPKRPHDVVKEAFDQWIKGLTKETKDAIQAYNSIGHIMRGLTGIDPEDILDPKVREAMKLLKIDTSKERGILSEYGKNSLNHVYNNPMGNYPLYTSDSWRVHQPRMSKHNLIYINAVYTAQLGANSNV